MLYIKNIIARDVVVLAKTQQLFYFYKRILIHLTYHCYGDINDTTMGYTWKKTVKVGG